MDKGRLISSGTVSDLIGVDGSAYFEVDDLAKASGLLEGVKGVVSVRAEGSGLSVETGAVPRSTLVAKLVRAGVAVETVTSRNRLEDAFLDLLGDDHR
jgi:ABC-2 type transport system ATP-binding protein